MSESEITARPPFWADGGEALHAWFDTMRESHPVLWEEESGTWQVFGYDDALTVLSDPAAFSNERLRRLMPAKDLVKGNLGLMDPPQHRLHHELIGQAFSRRAVAGLASGITAVADRLLDVAVESGESDVVSEIAGPLALTVIADLIGFPLADRPVLKRCADAQTGLDAGNPIDGDFVRAREESLAELLDYLRGHILRRRSAPQDDLTSRLALAQTQGRVLPDDVIADFLVTLLMGGILTTRGMMGNTVVSLHEHPGMLPALAADPALVPAAVEEVLRFRPSALGTLRVSTREVVLGGHSIPADQLIMIAILSANRDPRRFPGPGRFDLRRSPNRHLTFSHGIHFCLGAQLARLEIQILLRRLVERCREVGITDLSWLRTQGLTSPERLVASFRPR
ncbi:cytochrome P450 [Streptomyces sp. NPDC055078]